MDSKLIVVIGAYGSGKSEYSINLAKQYSENGHDVNLVDLDVVNPYFRSRDVREQFEEDGINVIAPEGAYKHADLPMISPRVMGAIQNTSKTTILDVGGDPAGCRTLGRFVENIKKRGYQMHNVINTKRPFTSSVDEIIAMINMLQNASKLEITELICNTNLMQFTDMDIVESGIDMVTKVSEQMDIDFNNYLVLQSYDEIIPDGLRNKEKITLSYFLNKPWEMPVFKGI